MSIYLGMQGAEARAIFETAKAVGVQINLLHDGVLNANLWAIPESVSVGLAPVISLDEISDVVAFLVPLQSGFTSSLDVRPGDNFSELPSIPPGRNYVVSEVVWNEHRSACVLRGSHNRVPRLI